MSSEILPKTPYVIVREGMFYFDMRVPVDVLGAFKLKFKRKTGAIRVSLRTGDRRQAQRLGAKQLSHYEEMFAELRRTSDAELVLANKVSRRDLSKLSRAELEKLVVDFYRNVLRPAAVSPPTDYADRADLVDEWSETLARVSSRRDEQGNERIQSTADHILLSAGWPQTSSMIGRSSTSSAAPASKAAGLHWRSWTAPRSHPAIPFLQQGSILPKPPTS